MSLNENELELSPRKEGTRDKRPGLIVQFNLEQINEHFENSITSIERQFEVADELLNCGKKDECEIIWRSQVVFVESSLDFYIHELSKYAMRCMYEGTWEKSPKYKNFKISMETYELCLEQPGDAGAFVEFINQQFGREVYLSFEQMRDQINLCGLEFTKILEEAFPNSKSDYGKEIIKELYNRRNQIAHQLDQLHENATTQSISKKYVEECIENVKCIEKSIHKAAIEKDSKE